MKCRSYNYIPKIFKIVFILPIIITNKNNMSLLIYYIEYSEYMMNRNIHVYCICYIEALFRNVLL